MKKGKEEENLTAEEINMSKGMKTTGCFLGSFVGVLETHNLWGGLGQVLLAFSFASQCKAED